MVKIKEVVKSILEYVKKYEVEKFTYEDRIGIKLFLFISIVLTILSIVYTAVYSKAGYSQLSSHRGTIRGGIGYIKAVADYLGDGIGAFIVCITFLTTTIWCIGWLTKNSSHKKKNIKKENV
ncbi:hypothetical protein SAMN02745163_00704 [Clostridium cavendishii DSM 21758]|uniref:Uncharacterized protein n=1 Tax=Clostridium cavendishii DSM 21758 TaxID=1121302 RepID=A0A1M6DE39_9CLOT|nr:hypothetical protein [Clostridium cavendishii]SHI71544.1 hypothetical protein SAMN02745163_00704 [Clostridium cavendishii DSM 21758]